ncbi:MAG: DUF3794 domain-containing protein [Limnochordia bacterium]|nr:DUF3794 domain-containing protein [Limnochordia bacterium]
MLGLPLLVAIVVLIVLFGLYRLWKKGQRKEKTDLVSIPETKEAIALHSSDPVYKYQCLICKKTKSETGEGVDPKDQRQLAVLNGAENAPEKGGYSLASCIKAQVVVGENTRQVLLENILNLERNAIKIREIRGEVRDLVCDVICDKVIVQGVVHKQIFFVGEDNMVYHKGEDVPFSTFLDIPQAEPGMHCQVEACIEHIAHHLLSPTLLQQKIVMEIFAKVTETQNIAVGIGQGPLVIIDEVVAKVCGQLLEEETIQLEVAARKISEIRAEVRDITFEPICDKVIVQGVVHKQIFFIDESNLERHQAVDIPFSHFVDAIGTMEFHDVQVHAEVVHVGFKLIFPPGAEVTTTLQEKVVVDLFIEVTNPRQVTVLLSDVGTCVKLEKVCGENTAQFLQETTIQLPMPAIKIRDIIARIEELETTVIDCKVLVQGIVHKQVFFIGEDDLEHHLAEDVPFSVAVDVAGANQDCNVRVMPCIEHISFDLLNDQTLHQKVIVALFVKVTETQQLLLTVEGPCPQPENLC